VVTVPFSLGWGNEPQYNSYAQARPPRNDKVDYQPTRNDKMDYQAPNDNNKPSFMNGYNGYSRKNDRDNIPVKPYSMQQPTNNYDNNPTPTVYSPTVGVSDYPYSKNTPIMGRVIQSPTESIPVGRRREMSEPKPNYPTLSSQELPKARADDYRFGKGPSNQPSADQFSPFKNNYTNMAPTRSRGDVGQQQISLHGNENKTSVKVANPPGGKTSIQLW